MRALTILLAVAAPFGPGTVNYDGWPPARYDAHAIVKVRFADPSDINGPFCGKAAAGMQTLACAAFDNTSGEWIITLPEPCSYPQSDNYARLACHEKGHANGWPGNHPK